MTKTPIPTENSKTNGQHKNATKNFDYTTIADQLRMQDSERKIPIHFGVNWSKMKVTTELTKSTLLF